MARSPRTSAPKFDTTPNGVRGEDEGQVKSISRIYDYMDWLTFGRKYTKEGQQVLLCLGGGKAILLQQPFPKTTTRNDQSGCQLR